MGQNGCFVTFKNKNFDLRKKFFEILIERNFLVKNYQKYFELKIVY